MIQGFSVSLGVFIRRLLITIFISNNSFSQVLPFTFSAHHKKNETQTNYALSFDGANDYINKKSSGKCSIRGSTASIGVG